MSTENDGNLRDRFEDLEDTQELDAAIRRNGDKPLIPWDEVKADLGLEPAAKVHAIKRASDLNGIHEGGSRSAVAVDIEPEEVDRIKSYSAEVLELFGRYCDSEGARFRGAEKPLQRFADAVGAMLANGRALISGVDEAHNELCVASQLLEISKPNFTLLEYEPTPVGSAKSIDFRAATLDGLTLCIDVKTIRPKPTDRWGQFEKALEERWFPENVLVHLLKDGLGGELWHGIYAARSRMLEHALGLEAKIRDGHLVSDTTRFVLCLCGEGPDWHRDLLEDFVAFYQTGSHRADDPFSKAEIKYLAEKGVTLDRTITRFACMNRPQFDLRQRHLCWNVRPPTQMVFEA